MSETLLGVIIGGILALIGGFMSQLLVRYYYRKDYVFIKKEELYIKAIDIITKYWAEIPVSQYGKINITNELAREFNSLKPLMVLYAEKDIYSYFLETIEEIVESKTPSKKDNNVSQMMEKFNQMLNDDLSKYIKR